MNLKKTILLVNVFITVLILWMLGSIVYTWASGYTSKSPVKIKDPQIKQPATKTKTETKGLKDFQAIIDKDIFNTLKDTSGAASINKSGAKAQQTSLNLKLRGTAVGENNTSYAIIFDGSTGKEDLYEIDDTIQGARLKEIYADKVILNFNGKEEALLLPVEKVGGKTRPYRPPVRKPRPVRKKTIRKKR